MKLALLILLPCLLSAPPENHRLPKTDAAKFPDCLPEKTVRLQGWLIFHEGKDIRAHIRQLQKQP